jgi:ABC-2 type transport system ATP-binding protein
MAAAIEVSQIVKDFVMPMSRKRVRAIDGLSFKVQEGGLVGFLGANGAGKTTTLKIILRLIFADQGGVKIFGKDNSDLAIRQHIGFMTERPYFYDYLTGREFLKFCAQLFNDAEAVKRVDPLLEEVGLAHAADRQLRRYSKGMLQRVGIAQAVINNPKLLILDEPMSGLDPDGRAEVAGIIANIHKRGTTVIFSTHLLPDVEHLCDRVIMINKGKLVVEDAVAALLDRYSEGWVLDVRTKATEHASLSTLTFKEENQLQNAIADAVKNGDKIQGVRLNRPSLEDVFLKLKSEARP